MSIRATITDTQRLADTANGNPRYLVTLSTGGKHTTRADSLLGYSIDHQTYRDNLHDFEIDIRGNIIKATAVR